MALLTSITPSFVFEGVLDFGTIADGTAVTEDVAVAVSGLRPSMHVVVAIPALDANLMICNAHVSDVDELTVRFRNATASGIVADDLSVKIVAF